MQNTNQLNTVPATSNERAAYATPNLVTYGAISALTAGGSGGAPESGSQNMTQQRP